MKKLAMALAFGLATLAAVIAAPGSSSTTQAQEEELGNTFLVSPSVCLALRQDAAAACLEGFVPGKFADPNVRNLWSNAVFDTNFDGEVTREEVNGFVPFSGNTIHEEDGDLILVVFVEDDNRVAFQTDEGRFSVFAGPPVEFLENFVCDQQEVVGGLIADEDCDGDGIQGDGLLYAQLHGADGDRGEHVVEVFDATNGEVIGDAFYVITGEPDEVAAGPFETVLGAGLSPGDCNLPTSQSGFLDALGQAEKTIIFGTVTDDDDAGVGSAWITWTSSDEDVVQIASGTSPTLDLGSFGLSAPNILCGIGAGTATITLELAQGPLLAGNIVVVDPGAASETVSLEITVLPEADAAALTATPAQVDCNGVNTAEVSAMVTADGEPVVNGTVVDWSVVTLGVASPLTSTTTDGIAKTVVTPLAGGIAGVTVVATVFVGPPSFPTDLNDDGLDNDDDDEVDEGDEFDADDRVANTNVIQSSIIVQCVQGAGAGTPVPGTTPGTGTGQPGGGGVTPPDTGSGGQAAGSGSLPVWPAVALFVAAMGLVGARFAVRRVE